MGRVRAGRVPRGRKARRPDPEDPLFQFSAYVFDASIFEIFNALCWGGCICIPSEKERLDNLAGAMNSFQANIAFLTPTVARLVHPDAVPSLKTLVLGGEAVSEADINKWAHRLNLISGYGPTECSMCSTFGLIRQGETSKGYIGSAVGSTSWIVDPDNHEKLVAVGAVGELLVLGPILA
jgi:non-ribosomal peptide synthetase component F